MKIILASDHRGFQLKEELKKYLLEGGYTVADAGATEQNPDDDYPDFAYPAALMVMENAENRGIFLCGSGMGMDVVANKVKGIRATVAYSQDSTVHARTNDDINVITLAADTLSFEEAKERVTLFLTTSFNPEERYTRRLAKLATIERDTFK